MCSSTRYNILSTGQPASITVKVRIILSFYCKHFPVKRLKTNGGESLLMHFIKTEIAREFTKNRFREKVQQTYANC